ncbi:spore germination protein YndE [Peptococcaceae bacterium CEB3]|nr:spore germination protein YndE [Peptococcaceae bacterium CEB3]
MTQEKISGSQLSTVLFILVMATGVLFVPGITARMALQSAWLVPLGLPLLTGLLSLWAIYKLGRRFPAQTVIEYSPLILGKIVGKGVGLLYILFFLITNILVIREFSVFLTFTLLPETPGFVLNIAVVLLAAYIVSQGVEVIARMAQFILPLFVASLSLLLLLSIPEMAPRRLLPFLEGGFQPVVKASLVPSAWYGEIVVLLLILPHLNKPRELPRKGVLALVWITVFLTLDILATLLVFGPYLSGQLTFPFWTLARFVQFHKSFSRLETLVVILWEAGMILKVALLYYAACVGSLQWLRKVSFGWVLGILGGVQILGACKFVGGQIQLAAILEHVFPFFALPFEIGLPLLLLGVARLSKAGRVRDK